MKRSRAALGGRLAAVILWLAAAAAFAPQQASAANCTAAQRAAADSELLKPDPDHPDQITAAEAEALKSVFPWGAPRAVQPPSHERLLYQQDYVIAYDDDLFGPVWSADWFNRKLPGGRVDCFRADFRIPVPVASAPSDYDEAIFDQGHMVPNGDMTFSKPAILNTFMMSNMSPQFCQFNRGTWQILEAFVRKWAADDKKPLYTITGAIFDRNADGVRDADDAAVRMRSRNGSARVAVPSAYYKVLAYRRPDGALETLTILLPHDQTERDKRKDDPDYVSDREYLDAHVVPIATVEAQSGLTFFPDYAGQRVEAAHLWDIGTLKYRSLVAAPCRKTAGAMLMGTSPQVYALP